MGGFKIELKSHIYTKIDVSNFRMLRPTPQLVVTFWLVLRSKSRPDNVIFVLVPVAAVVVFVVSGSAARDRD